MENVEVHLPLRVIAEIGGWQVSKWLVGLGEKVYRNQRVAVFKSVSSGAVEHALAPRAGTLHARRVSEGEIIEMPDAPIADIQFCPHSVVFKGVCAVCGEEAEQPHFAETSSQIETRLPVAYNATSLSVTRAEAISVSSSTARRLFESNRLSLVLDLDHTLVHATDDPRAATVLHHSPENVDLASISSFTLGPHPDTGPATMMYLKLRPNLAEFLTRVAAKFELHIYTMGSRPYADRVAQLIDPDKRLFSGRITSREDFAEGRCNQKSIERLFPCDDSMVLIVDDREDVWISGTGQTFMPNLIRADPYCFWDGFHEAYDRSAPANTSSQNLNKQQAVSSDASHNHSQSVGEDQAGMPSNSVKLSQMIPISNGTASDAQVGTVSQGENRKATRMRTYDDKDLSKKDGSCRGGNNATANSPGSNGVKIDSDRSGREGEPNASRLSATGDHKINGDSIAERSKMENGTLARDEACSKDGGVGGKDSQADFRVDNKERGDSVVRREQSDEELRKIVKQRWDVEESSRSKTHLLRLAEVLEDCHREFFRQSKLAHFTQDNDVVNASTAFRSPADVKEILADMRRQVLSGCVLTFTGVIPTGAKPDKIPAWNLALRLGATCSMDFVNGRTTHVVASEHRSTNTMKTKEAFQRGTAYVVTMKWLEDSALSFQRQDELLYCDRARQKFTTPVEFREFVERQHAEAARLFRKRRSTELQAISAKEVTIAVKRRKIDGSLSRKNSGSEKLGSVGSEGNVRVLSGDDEIGAAMDAVFDD